MVKEKTFFSYSRKDSEFVLKLARDLRDAGVNIWLDQLDIPAGKRWDTEIEKALEGSQIQLVILSPSAVSSQNCMDEVSYALEEKKRVIPILLKDCQIPFRLKRLQNIDFRGNYEYAFSRLCKEINPDIFPPSPSPSPPIKNLLKWILTGLAIAIVVISSIIFINSISESEQNISVKNKDLLEEKMWTESVNKNSISAYETYLNEFPDGKYFNDAKAKIKNFIDIKKDDWIAFTSNRNGNREIYIRNADGSNQIQLTDDKFDNFDPSWSPDGSRIVFSSNRNGNSEIYLMNADGSNKIRVTNAKSDDLHPSWSPDGGRIAFDSDRDGNVKIYIMNANGSEVTRLTNYQYIDQQPFWSPDGSRIAFSSNRDGNWEIYIMNVDGSNQTRITNNNFQNVEPSWSPDGNQITFSSNRDGIWQIYIMNADGSKQIHLTNNKFSNIHPSWSSDGKRIAFSSNRNGNWEIYIMNADGSELKQLIEGRNPTWANRSKDPELFLNIHTR